jgi:MFS family permease
LAQPLLRVPGFALYLTARFMVGLILRALVLTVGFHIYELTNDPIALGYVGLAMFLPVVGLGLVAGDLLDRQNRATVLTVSSLLGGASALGLLAVSLSGTEAIWPFYALIALFGISFTFSRPAMPAMVPQLVGSKLISNGIAMASSTSQLATMLGPPIAGALLIAGPSAAYAVTAAISFVAAAIWFILRPHAGSDGPGEDGQSMRSRIAEGLRIVFRTPLILGCMSLDLFAMLLGSVVALLPIFARDILMVGPFELGLLRAAPAVGATLMAIALSRFMAPRPAGTIMLGSVACFGVSIVVFGLSQSLTLSLIALAFSGSFDMLSNVLRNTVVQLSAPNAIRGRVNAVNQLFISGSNELGDFRAGVSAGLLGTIPAVMVGAIGTMAVAGLWALIFPSLRKLERVSDVRDQTGT